MSSLKSFFSVQGFNFNLPGLSGIMVGEAARRAGSVGWSGITRVFLGRFVWWVEESSSDEESPASGLARFIYRTNPFFLEHAADLRLRFFFRR